MLEVAFKPVLYVVCVMKRLTCATLLGEIKPLSLPGVTRLLFMAGMTVLGVLFSYALLDRPLVVWAQMADLRQYRYLHHMQALPEYFIYILPLLLALALLLHWAYRAKTGAYDAIAGAYDVKTKGCANKLAVLARLSHFRFCTVACALSVLLSLALKYPSKYVFARTWPDTFKDDNPSWLQDGVYGFQWFEPGVAYQSFPSGHTLAVSAVAMVVWYCYPRLRLVAVAMIASVVIGLLALYYHFLSDVLAGFYLGWLCAVVSLGMLQKMGQKVSVPVSAAC
jgi:membrane-associated phospholipid phosphatase